MDEKQIRKLAQEVSEECFGGKSRRLSRMISGIYDKALQPHGLNIGQASILVFLLQQNGAAPGNIGSHLHMDKSTVSRTIKRMKENGWVATRDDSPRPVLAVTEAGAELILSSYESWKSAQDQVYVLLGAEGAAAFTVLADKG